MEQENIDWERTLENIVLDKETEGEEQLSKEEEQLINGMNLEEDIDQFLIDTANKNTTKLTDSVMHNYNTLMAAVAKVKKREFKTLHETHPDDLPDLLTEFFKLVRNKRDKQVLNASTYTTYLTCISRILKEDFEPAIDLAKDLRFHKVRKMVKRMKASAQATKGKKPGANAARAVDPAYLRKARQMGFIGRENPHALLAATYLVATTGLGCRAGKELLSMTNEAFIVGPVDREGVPEFVELDESWVSKNRSGNDPKILESRIVPDHEKPSICPVRTFLEYQRRKTAAQNGPKERFWWNVKPTAVENPESEEKWFKNCAMGIHTITKLLTNALQKAGVDTKKEGYSATSARKTMQDGGLDAGIPETILGRLAGQRSDKSKRAYIQNKQITQKACALVLNRVAAGEHQADYYTELRKLQSEAVNSSHMDDPSTNIKPGPQSDQMSYQSATYRPTSPHPPAFYRPVSPHPPPVSYQSTYRTPVPHPPSASYHSTYSPPDPHPPSTSHQSRYSPPSPHASPAWYQSTYRPPSPHPPPASYQSTYMPPTPHPHPQNLFKRFQVSTYIKVGGGCS